MQNEITELRNQVRTLKRIVCLVGCLLVAGCSDSKTETNNFINKLENDSWVCGNAYDGLSEAHEVLSRREHEYHEAMKRFEILRGFTVNPRFESNELTDAERNELIEAEQNLSNCEEALVEAIQHYENLEKSYLLVSPILE